METNDHRTDDRRTRGRLLGRIGGTCCLGGIGLMAGSFLAYGPAGALLSSTPGVQVAAAATISTTTSTTSTHTTSTKAPKTTKTTKSTKTTTTSTAVPTATPLPVAAGTPMPTPVSVPTPTPQPDTGTLGTAGSAAGSTALPATGTGAGLTAPDTGADLPLAAGGLLTLGGAALLATARRRR